MMFGMIHFVIKITEKYVTIVKKFGSQFVTKNKEYLHMKKSLSALIFTGLVLSQPLSSAVASPLSWTARTADDVIASVLKSVNAQTSYEVQWGDTLSSIAQALDLSVLELAALNNIENPDLIIAGSLITFDRQAKVVTINNEVSYSAYTGQEVPFVEVADTAVMVETTQAPSTEEVSTTEATAEASFETNEATVTGEVMEETTVESVETTTTEVYTEAPTTTMVESEAPMTTMVETQAPITVEVPQTTTTTTTTTETEAPTTTEVTTEVVTEAAVPSTSASMTAREAFDVITAEKGIGQSEKDMWASIINQESGWNTTIANPYSGAYGLPQALPGNKMASHGADWATNPYTQLSWMYDYMITRFGSISGAYQFKLANGWY